MLKQYLYTFLLLVLYSGNSVAEFKITKVQTSLRKAIMVGQLDQTLNKGDELLLLGDDSKCLVTVIGNEEKSILISTEKCEFKIKTGNTVLDPDFFNAFFPEK